MPIYKIGRRGEQVQEEGRLHRRLRLIALFVSALLLLGTAALFYEYGGHLPL